MSLHNRSNEVVTDHWARIQGCSPAEFERTGLTVHRTGTMAVSLFVHGSTVVVSAPDDLHDAVRARHTDLIKLADGERERAAELLDVPVAEVLGPQFLGYADEGTFEPVERGAGLLDADDADGFADLRAACPEGEWERGGMQSVQVSADPVAGSFANGSPHPTLAAVATFSEVRDDVAGIGVVAHPSHRGEGHAKAAVSRITTHAFARGFPVVEYRTLERWESSVGLAEDLGFQRWGKSILVKLDA
jgi:GNAT superfamily N-acetyltransferase